MNKLINKVNAFTLAEVLITLVIIGVVAAITIPLLNNAIQDQIYKTAYKKAYSIASQAWMQAVNDNNIETRPSWGDAQSKVDNFNAFKSYFKVAKDCNSSNNAECWILGEQYYGSNPLSDASAFVDNAGMTWSLTSSTSATGAELMVDTNGFQKPNKYGQDRFVFWPVTQNSSVTGLPIKLIPLPDCISDSNCNGYTTSNRCPSAISHPCNYTSWIYN